MGYNSEVVRRARNRLESAKADRETMARIRRQEVYNALPRVREIDLQLRRSMALAAQSVMSDGLDSQKTFQDLKDQNLSLQQEKQKLIDEAFGAGYLEEGPICPKCGGEGYIGSTMCSCLLELCRQEQEKELTLLASPEQTFQNFRLDYYPDQVEPKLGYSPREIMAKVLEFCKNYADTFTPRSGNLLFSGGTGLGKTFLSACIARAAAAKGCSVAYETAQSLFSKMEQNQFKTTDETQQAVKTFMDSDLLIIDDLGTELPGAFITSALYAVVNERILSRKPMVISTNLTINEIAQRYSPQIGSRLQGDFKRLTFVGQDIRCLKNRGI